ncbi:MAG: MFS transporter [Gaiellaceae bacterium]
MPAYALDRFGALAERPFRLLWLGRTCSSVGDALIPVAIAFTVLSDLNGSAAELGLVAASYTIARVAFILVGGVWADRLPRRLVMLTCDAVRCVSQATVAGLLFSGGLELWMLALFSAVSGAAAAFFGPASTGLVPETISRPRLQQANALFGLSEGATSIFGPALAGVLIAGFGTGVVFVIDAASYAVSAAFLLALRAGRARAAERDSFLRDLARGWREVRARAWLQASFAVFALSNLSIACFFVLGPVVFEEELGGAGDWGLALTIGAVGGSLGSVVALRYRPGRPLLPVFLVCLPISLTLLALVPPLPAVAVGVVLAASFGGVAASNAIWDTVLQANVPRDTLSRVSSYDWLISLVFMPVGFVLAGPVAEAIGRDTTLLGAAALSAGANLGVLLVPSVRGMRRRDGPYEPVERPAFESA